ncbi:MAG: hypothetical protein GOP50_08515 [Candidatus Heimdallarchaeota archaeon]|nr:hypothetical protein [Candidatus Heimdallarchaeota archaeon]
MSKEEFSFENYSKLKEESVKVAEFLKKNEKTVAIIAKAHPDNISASGIIISCLRKLETGSHTIIISNFENIEDRVKKTNYSIYVFIGFEAKELPNKLLKDENKNIVLIEHSFTIDKRIKIPWENIQILSLKSFELAGNLLSNSGIAYLIASGLDDDYYKYAGLAILGGLSKKQINQKNQKLVGINLLILEEGKENKVLRETTGTRIPGRESQPIHLALKYSNNPFFPGLTGNESACTSFVSKLGIAMKDQDGNYRTISALTSEETIKLNDGLVSLLMGDISNLRGPIYILETETIKDQTRNIEEYLWLLDGAIQLQKYGLALAIVLGDRENLFDKLIRELSNYHGKATTIIEEIIKNPEITEDLQYYRLMRNQDFFELESAPLVIKALVDSNIIPIEKPLILHIKENSANYLFVHDSPSHMKKGYLSFQIFQDLRNKGVIKESTIRGDIDFFYTTIKEEEMELVLKELENALAYHHKGKDSDKN